MSFLSSFKSPDYTNINLSSFKDKNLSLNDTLFLLKGAIDKKNTKYLILILKKIKKNIKNDTISSSSATSTASSSTTTVSKINNLSDNLNFYHTNQLLPILIDLLLYKSSLLNKKIYYEILFIINYFLSGNLFFNEEIIEDNNKNIDDEEEFNSDNEDEKEIDEGSNHIQYNLLPLLNFINQSNEDYLSTFTYNSSIIDENFNEIILTNSLINPGCGSLNNQNQFLLESKLNNTYLKNFYSSNFLTNYFNNINLFFNNINILKLNLLLLIFLVKNQFKSSLEKLLNYDLINFFMNIIKTYNTNEEILIITSQLINLIINYDLDVNEYDDNISDNNKKQSIQTLLNNNNLIEILVGILNTIPTIPKNKSFTTNNKELFKLKNTKENIESEENFLKSIDEIKINVSSQEISFHSDIIIDTIQNINEENLYYIKLSSLFYLLGGLCRYNDFSKEIFYNFSGCDIIKKFLIIKNKESIVSNNDNDEEVVLNITNLQNNEFVHSTLWLLSNIINENSINDFSSYSLLFFYLLKNFSCNIIILQEVCRCMKNFLSCNNQKFLISILFYQENMYITYENNLELNQNIFYFIKNLFSLHSNSTTLINWIMYFLTDLFSFLDQPILSCSTSFDLINFTEIKIKYLLNELKQLNFFSFIYNNILKYNKNEEFIYYSCLIINKFLKYDQFFDSFEKNKIFSFFPILLNNFFKFSSELKFTQFNSLVSSSSCFSDDTNFQFTDDSIILSNDKILHLISTHFIKSKEHVSINSSFKLSAIEEILFVMGEFSKKSEFICNWFLEANLLNQLEELLIHYNEEEAIVEQCINVISQTLRIDQTYEKFNSKFDELNSEYDNIETDEYKRNNENSKDKSFFLPYFPTNQSKNKNFIGKYSLQFNYLLFKSFNITDKIKNIIYKLLDKNFLNNLLNYSLKYEKNEEISEKLSQISYFFILFLLYNNYTLKNDKELFFLRHYYDLFNEDNEEKEKRIEKSEKLKNLDIILKVFNKNFYNFSFSLLKIHFFNPKITFYNLNFLLFFSVYFKFSQIKNFNDYFTENNYILLLKFFNYEKLYQMDMETTGTSSTSSSTSENLPTSTSILSNNLKFTYYYLIFFIFHSYLIFPKFNKKFYQLLSNKKNSSYLSLIFNIVRQNNKNSNLVLSFLSFSSSFLFNHNYDSISFLSSSIVPTNNSSTSSLVTLSSSISSDSDYNQLNSYLSSSFFSAIISCDNRIKIFPDDIEDSSSSPIIPATLPLPDINQFSESKAPVTDTKLVSPRPLHGSSSNGKSFFGSWFSKKNIKEDKEKDISSPLVSPSPTPSTSLSITSTSSNTIPQCKLINSFNKIDSISFLSSSNYAPSSSNLFTDFLTNNTDDSTSSTSTSTSSSVLSEINFFKDNILLFLEYDIITILVQLIENYEDSQLILMNILNILNSLAIFSSYRLKLTTYNKNLFTKLIGLLIKFNNKIEKVIYENQFLGMRKTLDKEETYLNQIDYIYNRLNLTLLLVIFGTLCLPLNSDFIINVNYTLKEFINTNQDDFFKLNLLSYFFQILSNFSSDSLIIEATLRAINYLIKDMEEYKHIVRTMTTKIFYENEEEKEKDQIYEQDFEEFLNKRRIDINVLQLLSTLINAHIKSPTVIYYSLLTIASLSENNQEYVFDLNNSSASTSEKLSISTPSSISSDIASNYSLSSSLVSSNSSYSFPDLIIKSLIEYLNYSEIISVTCLSISSLPLFTSTLYYLNIVDYYKQIYSFYSQNEFVLENFLRSLIVLIKNNEIKYELFRKEIIYFNKSHQTSSTASSIFSLLSPATAAASSTLSLTSSTPYNSLINSITNNNILKMIISIIKNFILNDTFFNNMFSSSSSSTSSTLISFNSSSSSLNLSYWICCLLYSLSRNYLNEEIKEIFYQLNGIELIAKILVKFSNNEKITSVSCRALVTLLYHDEDDEDEVNGNSNINSEEEKEKDNLIYTNFLKNHKNYYLKLNGLNITSNLVEILRQYPSNPSIVKWTSKLILFLIRKNESNLKYFLQAGISEIFSILMQSHLFNQSILLTLLEIIHSFIDYNTAHPSSTSSTSSSSTTSSTYIDFINRFSMSGGCETMIQVLKNNLNHSLIVLHSSIIINSLSKIIGNSNWFGPAGACEILTTVLTIYADNNKEITMNLILCIGNLCNIDTNKERFSMNLANSLSSSTTSTNADSPSSSSSTPLTISPISSYNLNKLLIYCLNKYINDPNCVNICCTTIYKLCENLNSSEFSYYYSFYPSPSSSKSTVSVISNYLYGESNNEDNNEVEVLNFELEDIFQDEPLSSPFFSNEQELLSIFLKRGLNRHVFFLNNLHKILLKSLVFHLTNILTLKIILKTISILTAGGFLSTLERKQYQKINFFYHLKKIFYYYQHSENIKESNKKDDDANLNHLNDIIKYSLIIIKNLTWNNKFNQKNCLHFNILDYILNLLQKITTISIKHNNNFSSTFNSISSSISSSLSTSLGSLISISNISASESFYLISNENLITLIFSTLYNISQNNDEVIKNILNISNQNSTSNLLVIIFSIIEYYNKLIPSNSTALVFNASTSNPSSPSPSVSLYSSPFSSPHSAPLPPSASSIYLISVILKFLVLIYNNSPKEYFSSLMIYYENIINLANKFTDNFLILHYLITLINLIQINLNKKEDEEYIDPSERNKENSLQLLTDKLILNVISKYEKSFSNYSSNYFTIKNFSYPSYFATSPSFFGYENENLLTVSNCLTYFGLYSLRNSVIKNDSKDQINFINNLIKILNSFLLYYINIFQLNNKAKKEKKFFQRITSSSTNSTVSTSSTNVDEFVSSFTIGMNQLKKDSELKILTLPVFSPSLHFFEENSSTSISISSSSIFLYEICSVFINYSSLFSLNDTKQKSLLSTSIEYLTVIYSNSSSSNTSEIDLVLLFNKDYCRQLSKQTLDKLSSFSSPSISTSQSPLISIPSSPRETIDENSEVRFEL